VDGIPLGIDIPQAGSGLELTSGPGIVVNFGIYDYSLFYPSMLIQ
jgi:hypothetical protein